ncbi:TPA: response regulator transcription factor [Aeromonas dhakensis]|uniref:response regulator n=1 Tax=Aeromonas dhakensis TaxID=196024 RepID=UPI00288FE50D|nr:response regulator transcription factor [Aeromonas dhakensis]
MAKVMIVDDHPTIRMAVSMLLEQQQYDICCEVDNGVDAIKKCKECSPDVIIIDIGIPRLDGFEVIKRLRALGEESKIIVLSAHSSQHIMLRCYRAGANGFVSKLDDISIITKAVYTCLKGKLFFQKDILIEAKHSDDIENMNIFNKLSDREMSVLLAICQGKTNKIIADDMLLSEKTISTYKTRLMKKLQVGNIIDLLEIAKRNMIF